MTDTFEQRVRRKAVKSTDLTIKLQWDGNSGSHTDRLKLSRKDDFVQVWLNNGEKHCSIRLDDAMQQKIVEYLKK